jgi:hypothetical protein
MIMVTVFVYAEELPITAIRSSTSSVSTAMMTVRRV